MTRHLPPLTRLLEAVPFALPLRAPFRGLSVREGVVIRGPAGWGEFAPFPDYDVVSDARWLASAIAGAVLPPPVPVRSVIPVNAILPEVPAGRVAPFVAAAVRAQGCTTVKVKVGGPEPAEDVALVAAVRTVLDDEAGAGVGRIRIDANGRWTAAQAALVLAQLRPFGLEYVEQPCRSVEELRRLRTLDLGVPVAVDESIRLDRAWREVGEIADVAVLKVSPLGGPEAVLALATEVGVAVVLSGALESSVGLAQDAAVAAALAELPFACGFGTGALLADDLCEPPLVPDGGAVRVGPRVPGRAALERASGRLPPGQRAAWLARLDAAWEQAAALDLVPVGAMDLLGLR